MTRVRWQPVLDHAAAIVASYDTGVTLRQCFYRLVADGTLPNSQSYYRRLSSRSAQARRAGDFPDLLDRTSRVERPVTFTGPDEARSWLRNMYRTDRTAGQPWTVVLGVEKAGMSEQLEAWFTDPLGVPHVALGGYASQTLVDEVARLVDRHERPALFVYAGDHDPTGEDIDRDFVVRVGRFDKVHRVALTAEQVDEYRLPANLVDPEGTEAKLRRDPRAARFVARHGSLWQYEVDALPPNVLRNLYRDAIDDYWNPDVHRAALDRETADRDRL